MKKQVVAIRDRAVNAYGQPIFVHSIGQAIRVFGDEVNRDGSDMNKHPDDYDLFHLGEYDELTGQFTNIVPDQIAIGKNLKQGA